MPRLRIAHATLLLALLTPISFADDNSYRAGVGLLNKGMHDLAAPELRKYLDANPDGKDAPSARYCLGVCLVRQGKHADAAELLATVADLKGFEFAPDASLLLAQCTFAAGDDSEVVRRLSRLIAGSPTFASLDRVYQLLGESLYRAGSFEQSREASREVAKRWPASAVSGRAELFVAMAAMALGDTRQAVEAASALRGRKDGAELASRAALIEAQCRRQAGEGAKAIALYEAAAADSDAAVRVEALLGLAQAARVAGKHPLAEDALKRLAGEPLASDAGARAMLERGRLLFDQGRHDQALKAFERVEGSDSLSDDAAYWAAKCDLKAEQFAAAADRLKSALDTFPESDLAPAMSFDRAWALARAGDDEAALALWTRWRREFAEPSLASEALAAEAACAHRLGRFEESLALCERFLDTSPGHSRASDVELLAGENEFALGRYDAAERAYAALLNHHPESEHAWRARARRGLCLVELGKADEAAPILAGCAESREGDPALRAAALAALGELSLGRERWKEAAKWFGALAELPTSAADRADARLRQGIALSRSDAREESVAILKDVADSGEPTCALHARFELGQVLLALGKLDEARATLESVVEKESASGQSFTPHARRHLAAIASRQGRPDDAAALLGDIAAGGDGSAGALIEQGAAYLAAGKFDQAEKAFSEFLSRDSQSPRAEEARARRAIAMGRQGRHQESVDEIEALRSAPSLDSDLSATLRYERALNLRALGRADDAAAAYRHALAGIPPPRLEAYAALDLAQIESDSRRDDAALALLDRCVGAAERAAPAPMQEVTSRAAYLRGVCLLRLDKPADAVKVLGSIASDPDSDLGAAATLALGEALLRSGRAAEAAALLTVLSNKDAPGEIESGALLRLGEAAAGSQQWLKSEQAFTRFLDRFKDSPHAFQARFGLAWAQENQGRYDAAIESYRQVIASHQSSTAARAQFQIGECLFAQKKLEQAAAELLKTDILFAYPEWSAAALYEAGRCLSELGRAEEGAKQHDELIARFPDSTWARMAKDRRAALKPQALPGRANPR
ncbi:hypothetical protein PHYC_03579 [Phycisphaerales bacterium]|nr:hypothetical protein PHYC_03579 [Phycisphaerales bacterium]